MPPEPPSREPPGQWDWKDVSRWMRENIDDHVSQEGVVWKIPLAEAAAQNWDRLREVQADPDHWVWRAAESTKAWYDQVRPNLKIVR